MTALIVLSCLGLITLLTGLKLPARSTLFIAGAGLLSIAWLFAADWNTSLAYYNDMVFFDNYALAFSILIVSVVLLFVFLAGNSDTVDFPVAELVSLFLFSAVGAVLMVSFRNLVVLFLGIEILSVSSYVMAGSRKKDLSSNEAALKYFVMGSFATGFLLFGLALIYGATGSFNLKDIASAVMQMNGNPPAILIAGILLLLAGLAFKVSLVPFHFWTPDVYEGSPTQVTAFMSAVVKTAVVAAFLRIFSTCFTPLIAYWQDILAVLVILTITIGNITAVYQTSVKRMLAYSGIAHAGYIFLALVTINKYSGGAVFYYSAAYSFATAAAFTVLIIVKKSRNSFATEAFSGLGKTSPFAAFAATVAMLSLAGIPPTAGFFGKYYLFTQAMTEGHGWIVLLAVINSCIGVYYYFRVIISMYFAQAKDNLQPTVPAAHNFILVLATLLTLAFGLFPGLLIGHL